MANIDPDINPNPKVVDQQQQHDGVTYNEGNGIKDRVIISGPLSEVLAKQLNVMFQKKENVVEAEPSPVVEQKPASETYSQDAAIATAFQEALSKPDNQVILSNFDVSDIKAHMKRLQESNFIPSDTADANTISAVITDDTSVLDNYFDTFTPSYDEEIIFVNDDSVTPPLVRNTSNGVINALHGRDTIETDHLESDTYSVADKIKALERMRPGSTKHIHLGLEAFIKSLASRK